MDSSLPRHGARVRTKTQEKEQKQQQKKKKKKKPRGKLAQKKYRNNNLYDAWTYKCHDACSNAVITSSI